MIKGSKIPSRGVFQAGFWVLLGPSMPSVLVECGYLSNTSDEAYLKSDKGQSEIAKSIFKSIRYFKMDYDFENSLME
jgi:N-acetylmuramoyl-L-alanine amidase